VKQLTTGNIIEDIVKYWDTAGLSSPDSSTSKKSRYIASLDNFVESRLLSDIIHEYCEPAAKNKIQMRGVDIGAGLGRFSIVLAQHLPIVHALEPAESLFEKLTERCRNNRKIQTFNTSLESFVFSEPYDIAIVSGILYLYSDEMVCDFLKELSSMMKSEGIIIIRDFIVQNGGIMKKSSYIKNGYCYYRNREYWIATAQKNKLNCLETFRATPHLSPLINRIIQLFGISRIYSTSFMKNRWYEKMKKEREMKVNSLSKGINTIFIILKKDSGHHASGNSV